MKEAIIIYVLLWTNLVGVFSKLKLWKGAIGVDLKQDTKVPFRNVVVDYGYCITVHKSQGSEWDSVLVLESLWRVCVEHGSVEVYGGD
jgi:hypothetical protein